MNKLRMLWPVVMLSLLIIALIAACGPAAQGTGGENEAADRSSNSTTSSSAATSSDSAPEDTAAGQPVANAPLAVDPDSVTVDAEGIEVGYTVDGRPYRGDPDAPVVIEEYADYQCPYCSRFANQTLPLLMGNQVTNGDTVLVYYDFPLTSIHPQAEVAANAARCAGEQGAAAYWAMHDLLFINPNQWSHANANDVFRQYGEQLELEMESFNACLTENRYTAEIQADLSHGRSRGVTSTPSFFINNQILVGAQPVETFNRAIATIQEGGQLASAQAEPASNQPGVVPTPATISAEGIAFTLGSPDAPVTIVEYTDYQCPYCQRHATQTLPQIMSEMIDTGRVHYIIKDFPLESIHPEARAAAIAARCAGEQGAYWEMHEALFAQQSVWGGRGTAAANEAFAGLAEEMGLDLGDYNACLSSGEYDALVQADLNEGISLGVRGTPAFFINGYPVSGAQPYNLFVYAVDLAEQGTLQDAYAQQPQQQQQQQAQQPPSGPVEVPIEDAYSIGEADAPVTIVEFTDYQCPFCNRHMQQTYPLIKANYIDTGLVRYVFKDFPLTSIHPQALLAAQAARCAGDQDAYTEMHDQLFNNQQLWSGRPDAADLFVGYAEGLGLDTASFSQCLSSNQHEAAVLADLQTGIELGIQGTPGFFINGYFLNGAQPYSAFEQAINEQLAASPPEQ